MCTVYSCTCKADTHVAGVVGWSRDRHVAGDVPIHVAGDVGESGQAFNIDILMKWKVKYQNKLISFFN
jgi:hypothetical protein